MRGKFITFEGGEGAGKSTQVKKLCAFLRARGLDVVQTREVGGSPSAEAIRDLWLSPKEGYWDPQTELLLIMAARREHVVRTILPALERGAWVVSDRFADSTRAYQGIGLGLGLDMVDEILARVAPDCEPDLTLLLDLPVDSGLARVGKRGGQDDRYQQKNVAFHKTLREAFLLLAEKYPVRIRTIDATANEDGVSASIQAAVKDRFGL